jgi:trimeric autotransporter adhesin
MAFNQPNVLRATYGGTGVNNGNNTLTLAGNLATAGAFSSTFTMTGATAVTFPTSGTLATTAQLPTLPLSLANGGTGASLTASNGGIFYSTATAGAILAGTATASRVLLSGASATPSWSTATYPATAPTTGTVLRANGTNWLPSNATYPNTTTINRILYSNANNTISEIIAAANSTLVTDGSSVPTLSTTLPSAVQNNITAVNSAASTLSMGGSVKTFTTGAVNVPSMTNTTSWTPTIAFGGAAVGVTYSSNTGVYHTTTMPNGAVFVNFWGSIVLSNKGSSTGNLSISIPVATTNGSAYQFSVNGGNFSAGAGTQLYGNVNNSGSIAVVNFMGNGLANGSVTNSTTNNNSTLVFWGSYWTQ